MLFEDEKNNECCGKTHIILKDFPKLPKYMHELYETTHADSDDFLLNIRKYNA